MNESVFKNILDCRHLEQQSANESYKIAAKLHLVDKDGSVISYSRPNIKLDTLKPALDKDGTIGGASDTIHAETAVIMGAPVTDGGDLFVTDPLCPNCMKNTIESGIRNIFIDERGFEKKWYKNRQDYFDHISLPMAELAGLCVYAVNPETQSINKISNAPPKQKVSQSHPIRLSSVSGNARLHDFINDSRKTFTELPFALAIGRDKSGRPILIEACEDYPPGLNQDMTDILDKMQHFNKGDKYRIKNDPVTRLMMAASRFGISFRGSHMYCSHLPSARCQVNAVGYGLDNIEVGETQDSLKNGNLRAALQAAMSLNQNRILCFRFDKQDT